MAFGPVNTGGGASGSTLEAIYNDIQKVQMESSKAIQEAKREAVEAMNAHTSADNPHGITTEDIGAVHVSRKVNGKALGEDISLSAADVSAVPVTRKVNGKALSEDIELNAQNVGAAAAEHSHSLSSLGAADASHSHSFESLSGKVFHAGTTAPSNTGLLWIDTTANTGGLKYHNGSAWVHVPVAYT